MARYSALLLLLAPLVSCQPIRDFSPTHAFDMPSETEKGYAALAAGDYPGAVRWLTVAAALKPENPYLMLDLAAAYQKLGRFDDARRRYQILVDTARAVTPDKVTDPSLQGKALARIAAADLAQCSSCDLPPEAGTAYAALASGDDQAAQHGLEAAAKARPEDLYVMLDLASVDQSVGQTDAARSLYQKVIDTPPPPPPAQPVPNPAAPLGTVPPVVVPVPIPGKTLAEIAADDLARLTN
jgi:tetratricopeptide (TPR) repeat protein